jgi:hypothetical protein
MRNARLRNKTEFGTGFDDRGVGACAVLEASHVRGDY